MNKKEGISKEEVQKEKEVYGTKGDKWLRGFGRLLFLGITLYFIFINYQNLPLIIFSPLLFLALFLPARFWINISEFGISAKEGKITAKSVINTLTETDSVIKELKTVTAKIESDSEDLPVDQKSSSLGEDLKLIGTLTGSVEQKIDTAIHKFYSYSGYAGEKDILETTKQCYHCGMLNPQNHIFCQNCSELLH